MKIERVEKVVPVEMQKEGSFLNGMMFYVWSIDDKYFMEQPDSTFTFVSNPRSYEEVAKSLEDESDGEITLEYHSLEDNERACLELVYTCDFAQVYKRSDDGVHYLFDSRNNEFNKVNNEWSAKVKAHQMTMSN